MRRRRLLAVLVSGASAGLGVASIAPNIEVLGAATFALSALTVAPHVLIPLLVSIVPDGYRGRALAAVSAAMTTGIAASRVGSAWLGSVAGWHAVYAVAGAATLAVGVLTIAVLPRETVRPRISYGRLLRSTVLLLRDQPRLRWSIGLQMPIFATFNLVWAMLVLLLTGPPYDLPVGVAGLAGLLGLAPLLTAPWTGRLLDARGSTAVISLGLGALLIAGVLLQFSLLSLVVVVIGVMALAIGQQVAGVGNQSRTLALGSESRSRLNTLYMTSNFLGGAAASGLASVIFGAVGWPGVAAAALVTATIAVVVWIADLRVHRRIPAPRDERALSAEPSLDVGGA